MELHILCQTVHSVFNAFSYKFVILFELRTRMAPGLRGPFQFNKLSSFVDITSGVPQGSMLGPFLFLLFIYDISNLTTDGCVTNLFADDAMPQGIVSLKCN